MLELLCVLCSLSYHDVCVTELNVISFMHLLAYLPSASLVVCVRMCDTLLLAVSTVQHTRKCIQRLVRPLSWFSVCHFTHIFCCLWCLSSRFTCCVLHVKIVRLFSFRCGCSLTSAGCFYGRLSRRMVTHCCSVMSQIHPMHFALCC